MQPTTVIETKEIDALTPEDITRAEKLIESAPQYIEHFGEIGTDVAGFIHKYVAEEASADPDQAWMTNVAEYITGVITTISGKDEHIDAKGVSSSLIDFAKRPIVASSQKMAEGLEVSVMGTIDAGRHMQQHPDMPVSITLIKSIIPPGHFGPAPLSFIKALATSFVPAPSKEAK